MWAWAGFLLILTQLGVCGWAFLSHQNEVFNLFFTELSPVVLFFSLFDRLGIHIGIRVTSFLIFSLGWNVLKYTCYLCAHHSNPENKLTYFAIFLEAVYVGLATCGLFYFVGS